MTAERPRGAMAHFTPTFDTPTLAPRNAMCIASCPVTGLVAVSNQDKVAMFAWKRARAGEVLGTFAFLCAVEVPGCDAVMAFTVEHSDHGVTTPPHLIVRTDATDDSPSLRFFNTKDDFKVAPVALEGQTGLLLPYKVITSETALAVIKLDDSGTGFGISLYNGGGVHWHRTHVVSNADLGIAFGLGTHGHHADISEVCFGRNKHLLILEDWTLSVYEVAFGEHGPVVVTTYPCQELVDVPGQNCLGWEDPYILIAHLHDPRENGEPVIPEVGLQMPCSIGVMDTSTEALRTTFVFEEAVGLATGVRGYVTSPPMMAMLNPIGVLIADPVPTSLGLQFCLIPWFEYQCKPDMSAFRLAWMKAVLSSAFEKGLIAQRRIAELGGGGGGGGSAGPGSKRQRGGGS